MLVLGSVLVWATCDGVAKGAAKGTAVLEFAVSAIRAPPIIPVVHQAVVSLNALCWWGG